MTLGGFRVFPQIILCIVPDPASAKGSLALKVAYGDKVIIVEILGNKQCMLQAFREGDNQCRLKQRGIY